jgi:serine/threonine protein kinase
MNSEDSFATIKLDALAEQFVHDLRTGQHPAVEAFCDQHPELAVQIRELFPALARMEAVVVGSVASDSSMASPPEPGHPDSPETPGGMIGNYRLIRKIGEGGFGQVFECEQLAPVQRTVALKLIKPGMDSREVVSRFEAERQALASLDHPNIARVFDGGTTVLGRPFFVMELVRGTSITRYCDEHRLTVRERIELLIDVCLGIQHAHQKAIIHRDIKPSNILVTEVDGRPVCKVIDFGVSKALDSSLVPLSHQTRTSQMIGTPLYMSPEQANSSSSDTDIRSDVYSIGCVLYELLTGVTPFTRARLTGLALPQIQRVIAEEEIPSLMNGLTGSEDKGQEAASFRATSVSQLVSDLRSEPSWITLRCLEKDRDRRYQSALELSKDLQRYLHGEPVQAGPASTYYRIKKFVLRRKSVVLAASLLLASIVAGIAGTVTGLLRAEQSAVVARKQAEVAEKERDNARTSEKKLEDANNKLNARLAQLEKYNSLLTGIFSDFDVYRRRSTGPGLETLLINRLVETGGQLMEGTIDDPQSLALIEYRLGDLLHTLGRYDDAIRLTEHALKVSHDSLGPKDLLTLKIQRELAWCYHCIDDYQKAVPLAISAYDGFKEVAGPNAPNTLGAHGNAGTILNGAGRHEDALKLLLDLVEREREIYEEREPDTFKTMSHLGETYLKLGDIDAAKKWLQLAYDRQLQYVGIENPQTCAVAYWLAKALRSSHDPREVERAVRLLEESTMHLINAFGTDHPEVISSQKALKSLLLQLGRTGEAESVDAAHAGESSSTLALADYSSGAQKRIEVLTKVESELAVSGRSLSNEDAWTLICSLEQCGQFVESNQWREKLRRRSMDRNRRQWEESLRQSGPKSIETLTRAIDLIRSLRKPDDETLLAEVARLMGQGIGPDTDVTTGWQSIADHQQTFNDLTSRGFVPFDFEVQSINDQRQVNTTYRSSNPGRIPFVMWTGQTAERLTALKHDCAADQMELLVERTCQISGNVEYSALWQRRVLPNLARSANIHASHSHEWGSEIAVADGVIPLSSNDTSAGRHSWFSHLGTPEWIEYQFAEPVTCSRCGVYWGVDTNEPGCRLPKSWVVKYLDGDEWKEVSTVDNFATLPDRINEVRFQSIQTKTLRLEVQLQKNSSAGLFEWRVAP